MFPPRSLGESKVKDGYIPLVVKTRERRLDTRFRSHCMHSPLNRRDVLILFVSPYPLRCAHVHFSTSLHETNKQIALIKRGVSGQRETSLATPLVLSTQTSGHARNQRCMCVRVLTLPHCGTPNVEGLNFIGVDEARTPRSHARLNPTLPRTFKPHAPTHV